jgi:hypothetical protein
MSGGHFDYAQYKIGDIADQVEQLILNEDSGEVDTWGTQVKKGWSKETLEAFEEALLLLRMSEVYAQRIDWLVSGDDSEKTFMERLVGDLQEVGEKFKGE